MTNLDSILKSRDNTLPTNIRIVKAMFFPVVMYGYAGWTIKKGWGQRTDAFELWCWRRLLRVPWTARSNQSILNEINPEYSLEGLMLKLKLHYFGRLMWRANTLETNVTLGKTDAGGGGNDRGRDGGMASPTQWTWVWASSGRWWRTGKPGKLQATGLQKDDWETEQQISAVRHHYFCHILLVTQTNQVQCGRDFKGANTWRSEGVILKTNDHR